MAMSRFEKMGGTPMTPEQERTKGPTIGRSKGIGEMDEMQKLFEELMGGDVEGAEGSEDFDWEGLWNSLMGDEEGGGQEENVQGSQYPTMFRAPIRPTGFNRGSGFNYY